MKCQRTRLKGVIEVSDLAQIVQELVNSSFVVLNERIECHHVSFLRV
jgi:hypothetical protein